MDWLTKNAWVVMGALGVSIFQAGSIFVAYGHQLTFILALALPAAFVLHVVLFFQCLRPVAALATAIVLTLAGVYAGVFFAFNTYGT